MPDVQITEYSAAALGNLAAGSQQIKDAIREAGGIGPLVALLREDPNEISAELAAVVLRNLSLQNPINRSEIQVGCLAERFRDWIVRRLVGWIRCCVCFPQDRNHFTIRFLAWLNMSRQRPRERKRGHSKECVALIPHMDIFASPQKNNQSLDALDPHKIQIHSRIKTLSRMISIFCFAENEALNVIHSCVS